MACWISILCFCILCVVSCAVRTRSCCEGHPPPTARIPLSSALAACPCRSSGRPPGFSVVLPGVDVRCALRAAVWQTQNGDNSQQVREAWRTAFDTSRQGQEAADNPQHGSSLYDQRSRQHHVAGKRQGKRRVGCGQWALTRLEVPCCMTICCGTYDM